MNRNALQAEFEQVRWYALLVRSNQEKRVENHLSARGVEHFLPLYCSMRRRKDRRVQLELPLFPGYVFVRISLVARLAALTTPNAVSLVGPKHCPSPIADAEIESIRQGLQHGKVEPHPFLTAGQTAGITQGRIEPYPCRAGEQVVITEGPMSGIKGILLRHQKQTRVVVSIQSIARSFVVDIDAAFVEPVRPAGVRWADARRWRDDASLKADGTWM